MLTITRTVLVAVTISLAFSSAAIGKEFEELIGRLTKQFQQIDSIEYTSRWRGFYLEEPKGTPPLEKAITFKGRGNEFEFRFEQSGGLEAVPISVHQAYNGEHYQIDLGGQLRVTKKLPTYIAALGSHDAFLMPYLFLSLMDPGSEDKTPGLLVRLRELAKAQTWERVTKNAKGVRFEKNGNRTYMISSFAGMLEQEKAEVTVWFSLGEGGIPLKWQMRRPSREGKLSQEYEVTDLKEMNVRGQPFYFARTAKWRQYLGKETPCAEAIVELSDIVINGPISDEVFTFEPSAFNNINNLDENVIVPVPK